MRAIVVCDGYCQAYSIVYVFASFGCFSDMCAAGCSCNEFSLLCVPNGLMGVRFTGCC